MDYTLAIYRQERMDALSVELTVERLIRRGYPTALKDVRYDTRFPIRGLLVDRRYGHVLKMDRYKVVHRGYHGMNASTKSSSRTLSRQAHPPAHARYHWIDTLFALSEVTAYAAIVDAARAPRRTRRLRPAVSRRARVDRRSARRRHRLQGRDELRSPSSSKRTTSSRARSTSCARRASGCSC